MVVRSKARWSREYRLSPHHDHCRPLRRPFPAQDWQYMYEHVICERFLLRKLHAMWLLGSPSDISGAAYTLLRFHRNANTHGNPVLIHIVFYARYLLVSWAMRCRTAPLHTRPYEWS